MRRLVFIALAACGTNETPQPVAPPQLPSCVPNRDGAITRAEWDAAQAQRQQRFAARDQNNDGRPDGARFAHRGMGGGFGGHMFEMADANRDGRVSLQEAQAAALQHFDMVDTNRDGRISPEERMQMRQRMQATRQHG